MTVDALPNKVFKGHVILVGDQALLRSTGIATSQSTSGTQEAKDFKVVITLDEPNDELRPGLSCTAKITTATNPTCSRCPSRPDHARSGHGRQESSGAVQAATGPPSAPIKSNPVQGVFVAQKDPQAGCAPAFFLLSPLTGATDIEVLSGLGPGQEVVAGPTKSCAISRAARCLSAIQPSQ